MALAPGPGRCFRAGGAGEAPSSPPLSAGPLSPPSAAQRLLSPASFQRAEVGARRRRAGAATGTAGPPRRGGPGVFLSLRAEPGPGLDAERCRVRPGGRAGPPCTAAGEEQRSHRRPPGFPRTPTWVVSALLRTAPGLEKFSVLHLGQSFTEKLVVSTATGLNHAAWRG
ncbi:unnamed protein product [Coccothraustes coccothraustes]